MVSMVVAVCPLFPPATFVRPHDAKPALAIYVAGEVADPRFLSHQLTITFHKRQSFRDGQYVLIGRV